MSDIQDDEYQSEMEKMIDILLNISGGIINGAIVAGLGYAKSRNLERFDKKKFLQTAIVGGFVGGFAFTARMTYAEAQTWAASSGMITIIEYVKKAVCRRLRWKRKSR